MSDVGVQELAVTRTQSLRQEIAGLKEFMASLPKDATRDKSTRRAQERAPVQIVVVVTAIVARHNVSLRHVNGRT